MAKPDRVVLRPGSGTHDTQIAATDFEPVAAPVPIDVPDEPWYPKDVEAWSVRWVVVHLIGVPTATPVTAGIVRESIGDATWYALMAAAEGWPETP